MKFSRKTLFASILSTWTALTCNTLLAEAYLEFETHEDRTVYSLASAGGMDFYSKNPDEYFGEDILNIVPISISDRENLETAFKSLEVGEVTEIQYKLDNQFFLATIEGVEDGFHVKVVNSMDREMPSEIQKTELEKLEL